MKFSLTKLFFLNLDLSIKMLELITQLSLRFEVAEPREGDVMEIYSNSDKARSLLGWTPRYDLKDMISSAWNWQLKLTKTSQKDDA